MSDDTTKVPHGTFTQQAAEALDNLAILLATAVNTHTIGVLDWRQIRQHVYEVVTDAALTDGGLSEEDIAWSRPK